MKDPRPLSVEEDAALAAAARDALRAYRDAVRGGRRPTTTLLRRARHAVLHLGGAADPSSTSLKHYDAQRYGPFLGVSDDGSAAADIRDAALESPKVRALGNGVPEPLQVGVAVDAERLGGIGEVIVGPEEYADVWLACIDRVLITTNIGTRVSLRVYRREPRVVLQEPGRDHLDQTMRDIATTFKPFVETPDGVPRPRLVLVDIPRTSTLTVSQRKALLTKLVAFVASGGAAGRDKGSAGHEIGLAASCEAGLPGKASAIAAIDLAAAAGLRVVVLEGTRRRAADRAVSLAGLLDYFAPGIVGPLLRRAKQQGVQLRAANLPDTDTIARSVWVGLATARRMGAHLGKYGCFPLTLQETDHVVGQIQGWLAGWSAAPVFFVDQGLLGDGRVDVAKDLVRGILTWLDTVAAHAVRIVLIDTVDKATGQRLLKRSAGDKTGYLGGRQIERIEEHATALGVRVLWAGGLGLRDAFEMGRLGVFGIYVTSAAATTVQVAGSYIRDPALAGVKRPSKDAVLRTKILLEAGFLASRLPEAEGRDIEVQAQALLAAIEAGTARQVVEHTRALADACVHGWGTHWHQRHERRPSRRTPSGVDRTREGRA